MNFKYDIALSFAGEEREYVEKVANQLIDKNIKIFYDSFEKENLWGKDLYQHLSSIYKDRSRYTVIFISRNYARKLWTRHELRSAQARAFSENQEYILPARFDDTSLPGVPETIGYINLNNITPNEFANIIIQKLKGTVKLTEQIPDFLIEYKLLAENMKEHINSIIVSGETIREKFDLEIKRASL